MKDGPEGDVSGMNGRATRVSGLAARPISMTCAQRCSISSSYTRPARV
jgi:hypothetical protein